MPGTNKGEFLVPKNRRDHIVPRVYLRGFIDPKRDQKAGPLETFRLASNTWGRPESPDDLCAEIGFYDYSVDKADVTADDAFRPLEEGFGKVRDRLRGRGFANWIEDRDFLVRFGAMLGVRTRRFRRELIEMVSRKPAFRILEISGTELLVEPFAMATEPHASDLLKNRSITDMRATIERYAVAWGRWRWGLRAAPNVRCPFIASDCPVVVFGDAPQRDQADHLKRFQVLVPLGWDFALVGGPSFSGPEGAIEAAPDEMDEFRVVTASGAEDILISPLELLDMTWLGRARYPA